MGNKPGVVNQGTQTNVLDWLIQDEQEDDFLLGKIPKDLNDTWEDEE